VIDILAGAPVATSESAMGECVHKVAELVGPLEAATGIARGDAGIAEH
jgi:hypothetical protein